MDYETTYIGNRTIWGGEKPFGISRIDRRQHLYAIGKTGTGKTTLLRNLICQDIEGGHGVALIDPHGDLAEEILDCIPSRRADDLIYFNPADSDFPVGFNLVQSSLARRKYLEASGLVGAFKHIWRDSWGPRLEYILYAAIAALLECENVSLLGLPRMLADSRYRSWVLKQVRDPMVRSFWENEFSRFDKRFLAETIAPIQNKVGQLLMAAPLRNVFGQVKSKIDPRLRCTRPASIHAAAMAHIGRGKHHRICIHRFAAFGMVGVDIQHAAEPATAQFKITLSPAVHRQSRVSDQRSHQSGR